MHLKKQSTIDLILAECMCVCAEPLQSLPFIRPIWPCCFLALTFLSRMPAADLKDYRSIMKHYDLWKKKESKCHLWVSEVNWELPRRNQRIPVVLPYSARIRKSPRLMNVNTGFRSMTNCTTETVILNILKLWTLITWEIFLQHGFGNITIKGNGHLAHAFVWTT